MALKLSKYSFAYLSFFFLHISKMGWVVLIPNLVFFALAALNRSYRNPAALIVFAYVLYASTLLLLNFDSSSVRAALIDFKLVIMLGVFVFFSYWAKKRQFNSIGFAKLMVSSISIYAIVSVLINGYLDQRVLIRGDAGLLLVVALILLLPLNFLALRKNILWLILILLLMIIYQGRASMALGSVALAYYIFYATRYKCINRELIPFYFLLPLILGFLIFIVYSNRANDIASVSGFSVIESEARLMAMFAFVDVIERSSFIELIFGNGFGVDYSTKMECINPFVCKHIDNIIHGNGGIYPTLGFHNELIRVFLTTGIMGLGVLGAFFATLWSPVRKAYSPSNLKLRLRHNAIVIVFGLSLFSHGVLGTTITSYVLLTCTAVFYSEIRSQSKNVSTVRV